MSEVGGVGGSGGAVGPSAAGGMSSSQAVTPVDGAADSGDFKGSDGVEAVGDGSSKSGGQMMTMNGCGNMNTSNFVELHNSSVQSESTGLDLKKLIEMMMALKLLQEMNKSQ